MQSRPTVAEIDLDALAFNMAQVRKLVGPGVKLCPAVKADGYGHGAVQVSRTLLAAGAHMLGIATVEEGVELREAGIHVPLLLFGCLLPEQAADVVRHDITVAACDLNFANELSRHAIAMDKRSRVHIKVDTGMGRVGVQPDDAVDFALALSRLPGIEIEGVFTHFPCADEDLSFTRRQLEQFQQVADAIQRAGVDIPIRHAANSGAILNLPESHLDMVRPGIMIYGLYDPGSPIELRQCMTLKTRIVFVKEVEAGTTVGYGRTFTASRRTRVATIPIGYGDGYNRLLSNRGYALVGGRRVPIIGRVCMDQTMLDVTDVPAAKLGDEVVLYGRQGDQFIAIEDIARLIGTISYEVVCSLGKRVPRVYVRSAA